MVDALVFGGVLLSFVVLLRYTKSKNYVRSFVNTVFTACLGLALFVFSLWYVTKVPDLTGSMYEKARAYYDVNTVKVMRKLGNINPYYVSFDKDNNVFEFHYNNTVYNVKEAYNNGFSNSVTVVANNENGEEYKINVDLTDLK